MQILDRSVESTSLTRLVEEKANRNSFYICKLPKNQNLGFWVLESYPE